ncbi:UvrB/UvrC motif-containing protein [Tautonia plasticadhaerens]|uniref:UvrB/uvrC motif protein n=1 Tax=Tautonia plasticadhaerens TaxID=2527974 RepID=A0A518H890_9BACT|nr:UvrB/UvrC motif-containing protein [Tautonia plasticadhaerens]QDV37035.1 UvrB/uvrC motif protein [Tautonia plasticadhaerens]
MSRDITPILAGWDHDPDEFQVRIVSGLDGRDKLQMRLDLGLLQMELSGRPDGDRPFGVESLLDFHESRAREFDSDGEPYGLDASDCEELMREGIQYYHRYVALFHLGRYDLVARDTERNLKLFDFVRSHAARDRDKAAFDQYRPYVTMMRARALAQQAVDRGAHRDAMRRIDEGITAIKAFYREHKQQEKLAGCQELILLRELRREIDRGREVDPVERLDDQLRNAVAREDYEEAARIRDQIRRLQDGVAASRSDPDPSP